VALRTVPVKAAWAPARTSLARACAAAMSIGPAVMATPMRGSSEPPETGGISAT
jgi:hypothetical protein